MSFLHLNKISAAWEEGRVVPCQVATQLEKADVDESKQLNGPWRIPSTSKGRNEEFTVSHSVLSHPSETVPHHCQCRCLASKDRHMNFTQRESSEFHTIAQQFHQLGSCSVHVLLLLTLSYLSLRAILFATSFLIIQVKHCNKIWHLFTFYFHFIICIHKTVQILLILHSTKLWVASY